MHSFVVKKEEEKPLRRFLKDQLKTHSMKSIQKALDHKCVYKNGLIERFGSTLLQKGDRIQFSPYREIEKSITVLYEDEYFLIINKPVGLVSEIKEVKSYLKINTTLYLGHRLDKETSGVFLLVKSQEANEKIIALFREKKVKKEYIALADEVIKNNHITIKNRLSKVFFYQGQTIWGASKRGVNAHTEIEVLKRGKNASLVKAIPITGRTHQLRSHLSSIGHPILGDRQYANAFSSNYQTKRVLLHSLKIAFIHPFTKKRVEVKADFLDDFQDAINRLIK